MNISTLHDREIDSLKFNESFDIKDEAAQFTKASGKALKDFLSKIENLYVCIKAPEYKVEQ